MAPEGIQRHFRAVCRQAGHGVDGRAYAVDRLALTQGGNPYGGVQNHHAEAFVHHLMRLAALDEVYPVADAAGHGECGNEARIVDKAVVQRVIADEDMGIRRGASGKGSQHAGDGLLHAAVGRIAADLRVGVELEGKEEVGRMRTVRGPKGLSGTFSPCGAAQHTQKPAPDFPAGALWAVCLKAPEKRPEKDGSRIMGDGPPCLDGLGIADFLGFRNVRASGGKFRHAFPCVRQGGKAVHAALFHCDIVRAQIPFLIGPNTDAPDFGQQDGFAV